MSTLTDLGNDLYGGRRSIPFVPKFRLWGTISLILLVLVAIGVGVRGFNLGIEFTGGSDFRVPGVADTTSYDTRAADAVEGAADTNASSVTVIGGDTLRVQTERMSEDAIRNVTSALAEEFDVPAEEVTSSVVGPSWGASISRQALQALVVFFVLVSIVLALYFRTWKMAFAALVALVHDMILTVGIYSVAGFEITPASAIGFLTVLGYSIYDTVVVFDKVRENTEEALVTKRQTYSEAANLAVNQTLIRSINTTVVAVLPVAAVLVVGLTIIGPGTLLDLSLALFVGIIAGAYSSIFIAAPLLAWMREREPAMQQLRRQVAERREHLEASGVTLDGRGLPVQVEPDVPPTGAATVGETERSRPLGAPTTTDAKEAAVPTAAPAATQVRDAPPAAQASDHSQPLTTTGRRVHPSLLQPEEKPSTRPGRKQGRKVRRTKKDGDE